MIYKSNITSFKFVLFMFRYQIICLERGLKLCNSIRFSTSFIFVSFRKERDENQISIDVLHKNIILIVRNFYRNLYQIKIHIVLIVLLGNRSICSLIWKSDFTSFLWNFCTFVSVLEVLIPWSPTCLFEILSHNPSNNLNVYSFS